MAVVGMTLTPTLMVKQTQTRWRTTDPAKENGFVAAFKRYVGILSRHKAQCPFQ